MEIRFDRDLRHNYMVLCGLETREDYRLRMLSENCPEGLLHCSLRNINGAGYLYYEIDSRQPLRNRYADGGLGADDLRRLLRAVERLRETLEDYLLDAEHILFSADCVYTDMRTGDFYFVYCPYTADAAASGDAPAGFLTFAEELLSFLDQDDEEAGRIAYALCEMAGRGEMLLRDIVRAALEETEEHAAEGAQYREGALRDEEVDALFRPRAPGPATVPAAAEQSCAEEEEEHPEGKEAGRRKGAVPGLALLFAAVFAGNLVIRRRFYLDARENLLSLATAGLSLLMAVLSLALWMRGEKKEEKHAENDESEDREDGWIRTQMEEAVYCEPYPAGRERAGERISGGSFRDHAPQEGTDEETTVLSEDEIPFAHKLYGRNGEETINISLEHLPLTVGKLSGCADFVIRDPSISRMHTRFLGDASGAAAQMKDLNSTNGTFLNGRRLRPNETVAIRPGDEIGIGRLVFELR